MSPSNLTQLVRKRQLYTNEPCSVARSAILELNPEQPLIPWACPEQAFLEAQLLTAIGGGNSDLVCNDRKRQTFGLRFITPRDQQLVVRLSCEEQLVCQEGLMSFIERAVPRLYEGNLSGIPGLRVIHCKNGTALTLLNRGGEIMLQGVSKARWNRALARAKREYDETIDYLCRESRLHPAEREEQAYSVYPDLGDRRDYLSVTLQSGIIRRHHAFMAGSDMRFVDLWCNPGAIEIEWASDLSHFELIKRLLAPGVGLPLAVRHKDCYCDTCAADTYQIQLKDTNEGVVSVNLRWSALYEDTLPPRRTGMCLFRDQAAFETAVASGPA